LKQNYDISIGSFGPTPNATMRMPMRNAPMPRIIDFSYLVDAHIGKISSRAWKNDEKSG
jgi:hypothetical protein